MDLTRMINDKLASSVLEKLDIDAIASEVAPKVEEAIKKQVAEQVGDFDMRRCIENALERGAAGDLFDDMVEKLTERMVKSLLS